MKNLLLNLTVCLLVAAAGCGRDHATDPTPQGVTWTQVRLVDATGGPEGSVSDLSVLPVGALTLLDGRGNAVSSQGLLADGNLETLIRLVDALPPHSYTPAEPCPSERFTLTVARGDREFSYESGAGDADLPVEVAALVEFLRRLTEQVLEPFHKAVPVQIVLAGRSSAIRRAELATIRTQDGLAALLRRHAPDRPVATPRVDFARKMVVALFRGECPNDGYLLESAGAGLTESGRLRVRFRSYEPGPSCDPQTGPTQPFVLVAVDRAGDDFVIETAIEEVACE